jgi:hypothetical protein
MSKKVPAEITCPRCTEKFTVQLFRSLWIEDPANRKLVSTDSVNAVTCPKCLTQTRLDFPFLCTNVKKRIAIWYEPYHDEAIDKDQKLYAKNFGASSFYAQAPRIADWNEFKIQLEIMEESTAPEEGIPYNADHLLKNIPGLFEGLYAAGVNKTRNSSLGWISTWKKRLSLSVLPFLATFLLESQLSLDRVRSLVIRYPEDTFAAFIMLTGGSFLLLSAFHLMFSKMPWRKRSKFFRQFVFFSIFWAIGTVCLVMLFDPFDYDSSIDGEEFIHLVGVSIGIPAFAATAVYLYKRFVA